jgi:hypothetical protein
MMAKTAMTSRFEDFCVFSNKATFGEINKVTEKISNFINSFGADKLAKIMIGEGRYKSFASAKRAVFKKMILPDWNGYDNNFFDEQMYRYLEAQVEMPYTFDEYFAIVAEYKEKTKSVSTFGKVASQSQMCLNTRKTTTAIIPHRNPLHFWKI